MNALMPFAEQMLVNTMLNKKAPFMRKNKFGLGLAALSGLLFILALVFAAISAYAWVASYYAAPVAAIIIAGFVLCISIIAALSGYLLLRKRPQPRAATSYMEGDVTEVVAEIAEILGEELAEPIRDNPKTAMMLAGLAGFVAADRLH